MSNQVNWVDHIINVLSVIIGVSLAFWVNDSAERSKKARDLEAIVVSFIDELASDSATYVDYQIPLNIKQVEDIQAVIQFLAAKEYDSLIVYFESAIGLNNYDPTSTTFNSLSSSGKLELIEDFALKQAINTYHTVDVQEAELRGKFQIDFYINELLPWLMYNLDLTNPDMEKVDKVKLTNLLIVYAGIIENKIKQYEYVAEEAGSLKAKLEAKGKSF